MSSIYNNIKNNKFNTEMQDFTQTTINTGEQNERKPK